MAEKVCSQNFNHSLHKGLKMDGWLPAWNAASVAGLERVKGERDERVRERRGGQTVYSFEDLQLFM